VYFREQLENGIRFVADITAEYRSVCIGVWVRVGSRDEAPEHAGISHFLEHMHFKGTETRTARMIAEDIDGLGGELNAFTSREGTTFYVKVLDEHLDQGIDILSDIIGRSLFAEDDIEREKGPVLEEIRMVEDTPDDHIHDLFHGSIWGSEGLGRSVLGTPETVAALSRDTLVSFVKTRYRPADIVIAAAGNFDSGALVDKLNGAFSGFRDRDGLVGEVVRPPESFRKGARVYPKDLSEVHTVIGVEGLPQSHDDRYALYVLNTIFGSGVSSRLFQEIREQRGLVYSVYSYLASYADTGLLAVYAGTGRERVEEVVDLIRQGFGRLAAGDVDDDEVARAKEQLKGNLILGLESTSARMSQVARDEIYFGRSFTLDDIIAGIDGVTTDAVRDISVRLAKTDAMALVALGPVDPAVFGSEAGVDVL